MRNSLLASNRPHVDRKLRLLAAGALLLVLGVLTSAKVEAANVPGIRQEAAGTIAINLLDIDASDPPVESGALEAANILGGLALAEAIIACAARATCPSPGAVAQRALGSQSATNIANVDGVLAIGAVADAGGGAGIIQIGLWQVAAAQEAALNQLGVTGALGMIADADALGGGGHK